MIRLFSIFRNIKNVETVLRFYVNHVFPVLHQFPGVIGTELHSVSEVSQDFPQELENVQLIFETHFESYEVFTQLLLSPAGNEIMKLMDENDIGDYYIYWTKVKRFAGVNPSSYSESPTTMNTDDVYQALASVEKSAKTLTEKEQIGALKILEELRTELNFMGFKKLN
ncbi:hypothetical protein SAMN05444392_103200 [Seinonella peptonophila]|uniref:Uncharacterized protein n=1 Tax=Seinonella peptonophila TaxID=112248 RepID=A0A1M4WFQ6_9BACL|nr:hypothetical protein [Seinonella peptonophila]SHE80025.1 hypothetical protein SAMN05444392_103200 [Seinonella peptonophila]